MTVINNNNNNRRTDIEGLRGIAVLAVILFHSGFDFAAGGYVGVDIFFVLSGFLVAKTIKENIERNTFSLLNFYKRRFLRIVPASLVVIVIVGIIGLKVLLPEELKELSESIFYFLTLRSNTWAAGSVSYFGIDVAYKPLIHYWSLSVELQFYIIFPVFLNYFLSRNLETELWVVCFIVFLISFFYAAFFVEMDPNAGYFSALMRVWQFCLGALICLSPIMIYANPLHCVMRDVLAFIGITAVVASVFIFDQGSGFPGEGALIPCLGVVLILMFSHSNKGLSGKLLSVFWLRFIGVISFSLYLVHQPVFVFYRLFSRRELDFNQLIMVWGGVFFAACALFYIIEKRFIKKVASLPFFIGIALFISALYFSNQGMEENLSAFNLDPKVKEILNFRYDNNPRLRECRVDNKIIEPEKACQYGNPDDPVVVLWGDSHADQIVTPLAEALETYGYSTLEFAIAGCPPLVGVVAINSERKCDKNSRVILEYLLNRTDIEHVFLHAYWIGYFDNLLVKPKNRDIGQDVTSYFINQFRFVISELISSGKKVHIIYPVPKMNINPPLYLARRALLSLDVSGINSGVNKNNYKIQARKSLFILNKVTKEFDVTAIHISDFLYDSLSSSYRIMLGENLLYRDDNHLSVTGGRVIARSIAGEIFGD